MRGCVRSCQRARNFLTTHAIRPRDQPPAEILSALCCGVVLSSSQLQLACKPRFKPCSMTTNLIPMNGAESLIRTLVANGVDTCFANPGTSEMHFVAALDKVNGMRCVLCLFEGVATGAADGYYRMAERPAATLLHLGPGLANGLANLHNAKKAGSGIVNIVGEHASYHIRCNAPLTADIEGIARAASHWVRTSASSKAVASDGADAIAAASAPPGHIATLILPADTAWEPADGVARAPAVARRRAVSDQSVEAAAKALTAGRPVALLLGGAAVREGSLYLAGQIAAATGCTLLSEFGLSRLQRGAGRVRTRRIPYPIDAAVALLKEFKSLVLVGAKTPVGFFAYPSKPSFLMPNTCQVTELATIEDDIAGALEALVDRVGARSLAPVGVAPLARPGLPSGRITAEGIGAMLGALLPENSIVVDEAISTGRGLDSPTAGAPPHDWLNIVGGSIGFGLPAATGAAIASPDRTVVVLEGDGSAMYTLQALWTMAREKLNIKILVFANRGYQILKGELANISPAQPEGKASGILTLDNPALDWVAIAKGHGVAASSVDDLDSLASEFRRALARHGPHLIEVVS
jgi:acetolactate synthase-1/2/3 large subunit